MWIDWKMSALIGIVFILILHLAITATPIVILGSVLALIAANALFAHASWRMFSGQWTIESCVVSRINKYDDSVYYIVHCLIDGKVVSKFFFGEGAKDRAHEYLKQFHE